MEENGLMSAVNAMPAVMQAVFAVGLACIVVVSFGLGWHLGRNKEKEESCRDCAHTKWEVMTSKEIDDKLDELINEQERNIKKLVRKYERRSKWKKKPASK